MADDRRKRGEEWFGKVYGGGIPIPAAEMDADPFLDIMFKHVFGEIWPREGLAVRDRRFLMLGILAAEGEVETFGIQITVALKSGELTPAEVNEILIFLAPYVGYPRIGRLRPILQRILAEHKG